MMTHIQLWFYGLGHRIRRYSMQAAVLLLTVAAMHAVRPVLTGPSSDLTDWWFVERLAMLAYRTFTSLEQFIVVLTAFAAYVLYMSIPWHTLVDNLGKQLKAYGRVSDDSLTPWQHLHPPLALRKILYWIVYVLAWFFRVWAAIILYGVVDPVRDLHTEGASWSWLVKMLFIPYDIVSQLERLYSLSQLAVFVPVLMLANIFFGRAYRRSKKIGEET